MLFPYVFVCVFTLTACYEMGGDDIPFVLNFESPVYVCPDKDSQEYLDTSAVEAVRFNETISFLNGAVELLKGFESGTIVELVLEKESYGHYERVSSHEICDICSELKNEESPYYRIIQFFSFPEECPFEPGLYTIDNLIIDVSDFPINKANAGKYLATVFLYKSKDGSCNNNYKKELLACFKINTIVEQAN